MHCTRANNNRNNNNINNNNDTFNSIIAQCLLI